MTSIDISTEQPEPQQHYQSGIHSAFRGNEKQTDPRLFQDLRQTALFRDLNDMELARIVRRASEYRIPAEQYIVQEDMPAGALFVIREGSVAIVHDKIGRPLQPIAYLRRGDFFGENCLFEEHVPASVRALSACRVLRIPKRELGELAQQRPAIEAELRQRMTERHNAHIAAIVELGRRREVRIRFSRRLTLVVDDHEQETTLESLSLGGIGFRGIPQNWDEGLKVRFGLRIRSELLPLEGRLAWRRGDRAGIELIKRHPNHDALIQAMISWLREEVC